MPDNPAESVACQVDEDGGVCGLDSCPRCGVRPELVPAQEELAKAQADLEAARAEHDAEVERVRRLDAQYASNRDALQAEPLPSDVDAIESLAYVMALLSGVVHPDVMARLGVVWKYVRGHTDGS